MEPRDIGELPEPDWSRKPDINIEVIYNKIRYLSEHFDRVGPREISVLPDNGEPVAEVQLGGGYTDELSALQHRLPRRTVTVVPGTTYDNKN